MTIREMMTAIANGSAITPEMVELATAELEKMNSRNAKRSERNAEKRNEENEPIKRAIVEALADGAKVASELAEICEVTTQKVSALARQLTESGTLTVTERKVKGGRTVKEYALAE